MSRSYSLVCSARVTCALNVFRSSITAVSAAASALSPVSLFTRAFYTPADRQTIVYTRSLNRTARSKSEIYFLTRCGAHVRPTISVRTKTKRSFFFLPPRQFTTTLAYVHVIKICYEAYCPCEALATTFFHFLDAVPSVYTTETGIFFFFPARSFKVVVKRDLTYIVALVRFIYR